MLQRAVPSAENLEHAVQRGFEVEGAGQRLAHFEQRGQTSGFTSIGAVGGFWFHERSSGSVPRVMGYRMVGVWKL